MPSFGNEEENTDPVKVYIVTVKKSFSAQKPLLFHFAQPRERGKNNKGKKTERSRGGSQEGIYLRGRGVFFKASTEFHVTNDV